jgi:thiamine pyrophosphate-dependent acetolactate synthase large subunit-like protein
MRMSKAVGALCEILGRDELVVSANGRISRELYAAGHREGNFYMLGSMGHASSIALGVALARPKRRVIALDGDGSLIMNMGILATVRELNPSNFMHVVLDNGVYNTTGQQPSAAAVVELSKIAKAAGYRTVAVAKTTAQVRRSARRLLASRGPAMLIVKVRPGENPGLVRIPLTPGQIRRQFRRSAAKKEKDFSGKKRSRVSKRGKSRGTAS